MIMIENKYSLKDTLTSLATFVLGYLFVKLILLSELKIGALIFTVLAIVVGYIYMYVKNIRTTLNNKIFISISLVFSTVFVISENNFIKELVLFYLFFSYLYWLYASCGNRTENTISEMFILDMIKSVIIMPFSKFGSAFIALFARFNGFKTGKKIVMIILGLIIATIPTIFITTILMNADIVFRGIIENMLHNLTASNIITEQLSYILLSLPVSMFIFGAMYSNTVKANSNFMTLEKNNVFLKKCKFAPSVFMYTAVTPILFIYIIFFVAQLGYFTSAFQGILPQGYTYAEYARSGFFELCNIVIINTCIISLLTLITKNNSPKELTAQKIYITVLSSFTIMLIITALSKMVMYITSFGLTEKRIYTTWFMLLLTFIFILLIIKQYIHKLNFWGIVFIIFVIMFAILVFPDLDSIRNNYNAAHSF